MKLSIPDPSLVVLIGATGSGKSTFARRHFRPTEVLSSDAFRAMLRDDENDQGATRDAFLVLHLVAAKRLEAGRVAVVDATNVRADARRPLLALARRAHVDAVAIVLDVPEATLRERLASRGDRAFDAGVIERHLELLHRSLRGLRAEGFREVHVVSPAAADALELIRRKPLEDRRHDPGPFDVIGDVHGCLDELRALLVRLGYQVGTDLAVQPPPGRRALFLGDLVDRGPAIPAVLRLVIGMVRDGAAVCLPGNHEEKLVRWLAGRNVKVGTGLAASIEQLSREPPAFRREVREFLEPLVPHLVLDGGRLVVAHAGLKRALQGRDTPAARAFALYGDPTGATDAHGLPVRRDWAADYRGPTVVYGHTPVDGEPTWVNGTICIDTGCVFGGRLTALRWPERELVSVPAARAYASGPGVRAPAPSAGPDARPAGPAPRSGDHGVPDVDALEQALLVGAEADQPHPRQPQRLELGDQRREGDVAGGGDPGDVEDRGVPAIADEQRDQGVDRRQLEAALEPDPRRRTGGEDVGG